MALTLRNSRTPTIAMCTWIIMLIFCFAGYTTAKGCDKEIKQRKIKTRNCDFYGHSCWGAHGKRSSDFQDTGVLRTLPANVLSGESTQNDIPSSPKVQWILSHLITGRPVLSSMDKYRVRWSNFAKDKVYPTFNAASADGDNTDEIIRVPINNDNKDNEREISNVQDTMHNVNEKSENLPEFLLLSPNEYDEPINDLEKLNILKFLEERKREISGISKKRKKVQGIANF